MLKRHFRIPTLTWLQIQFKYPKKIWTVISCDYIPLSQNRSRCRYIEKITTTRKPAISVLSVLRHTQHNKNPTSLKEKWRLAHSRRQGPCAYSAFFSSSLLSSWNGIVYLSFKVLSLCIAYTLQRSLAENTGNSRKLYIFYSFLRYCIDRCGK